MFATEKESDHRNFIAHLENMMDHSPQHTVQEFSNFLLLHPYKILVLTSHPYTLQSSTICIWKRI